MLFLKPRRSFVRAKRNICLPIPALPFPSEYSSSIANAFRIKLTQEDIDRMNKDATLATGNGNTYVTVGGGSASDYAENDAPEVPSNQAIPVTHYEEVRSDSFCVWSEYYLYFYRNEKKKMKKIYIFYKLVLIMHCFLCYAPCQDDQDPNLIDFALNVDSGVLTLTFDEVVSRLSITPSGFVLQNAESNPTETSDALDGTPSTTDDTVITLTLTVDSANGVRALVNLATDGADTFLKVDNTAFKDVNDNEAVAVVLRVNQDVGGFIPDTSAPLATGFTLDLDVGTLTVSYEQPVKGSTVDPEAFTLENKATGADSTHSLIDGTVEPQEIATTFVLKLVKADLDEIKRKAVCASGTAEGGCFLRFKENSVNDATDQTVATIATDPTTEVALACTDYTGDETPPTLNNQGFVKFDLNNAEITFSFSETIDRDSVEYDKITVQASTLDTSQFANVAKFTFSETSFLTIVSTEDGTELIYKVSAEDINSIQQTQGLCSEDYLCVMKMEQGAFQDMAGNLLEESTLTTSFLQTLVKDTTGPTLESFELDMDNALLTLTFDETVAHLKLKPQHITLQSPTLSKTLTFSQDSVITSADALVMKIKITVEDMNEIKAKEFCSARSNTYLSLTSDTVVDISNNPVQQATLQQVKENGYAADNTPPTIGDFGLNLELGELTVTFNEPVEPDTANENAMTIQDLAANPEHTRVIGGATPKETSPSKILTFELSDADVAVIKTNQDLGTSVDDLYLVAGVGLCVDTAGNPSSQLSAIKAGSHVGDNTPGSVQDFTINFEARTLTLSFDENINAGSFDPLQVSLQSGAATGVSYTLKDSTTSSSNGETIVIDLSDPDLLGIGSVAGLATDDTTTYLVLVPSAFEDTLGRYVIAEPADKAKKVKTGGYIADSTPPEISKSSLDMTAGTLSLTFSEAIDSTTLESNFNTDLAIKNLGGKKRPLSGGTVAIAADAQSAVITLDVDDLNYLKAQLDLAVDAASSIVEHTSNLMADVFEVDTVGTDVTMLDADFEGDSKSPSLVTFSFNVDSATLVLTFDETILASSVAPEKITLQSTEDISFGATLGSFTLTDYASKSTADGTKITIVLFGADIDAIKERPLAVTNQNTYLSLLVDTVEDMNNNGIAEIGTGAATKVDAAGFVGDSSPPSLVEFELDLKLGTLTFVCSETIETTSVDPTAFRLQKSVSVDITSSSLVHDSTQYESYKLVHTTQSGVSTTDDAKITITLDVKDLNALKQQLDVAGTEATTFLSYTSDAASDMSTNAVEERGPTDGLAIKAGTFVSDDIDPTLDDASINLDAKTISFTFSEPVAAPSKFDTTKITLQAAADDTNLDAQLAMYTLTNLVSKTMDYATVITVDFTNTDLNAIKLASQLATSAGTTFVSVTSNLCSDVYGNPVEATTIGMDASEYEGDSEGPVMTKATLNMNSRTLTLDFDETVDVFNINVPGISVRTVDDVHFVLLTDESSQVTTTSNGLTVIISIGVDDANRIKANPDLAQVEDDTYVMIAANTILDMVPNQCTKQSRSVFSLVPDSSPPTLTGFSIDMTLEQLSLTFDETVDADTLTDASKISIRSQKVDTGAELVQLSGGNVVISQDYRYSTIVLFQMLSSPDIDAIKKNTNIAINGDTSFIKLDAGAIKDTSTNSIVAAISEKCGDAGYTVDSKKPVLLSFNLDMHAMQLRLTFSETVLASSLVPAKVTLQYAESISGTDNVRKLTSGAESTSNLDSVTLVISLNDDDANAIKKATGLGTMDGDISTADGDSGAVSNTFITFEAGAVTDMALPAAVAIDAKTIGMAATLVVTDNVAPTLVGQTLNMHDGYLVLTFSETVKASTLQPTFFTIHGGKTTGDPFLKLTGFKEKSTVDSTELTITLTDDDMNNLKKDVQLATSKPTTVVSALADGVRDMVLTAEGDFNSLSELAVTSGFDATAFTRDERDPELLEYKLDMHNKVVQMTFSETMKVSTLLGGQLTFYDEITNGAHFMLLTGGTAEVFGDATAASGTELTLSLTSSDFNELQKRENLATSTTNTFMALAATAEDMNGNFVVEIVSGLAQRAKFFADDEIAASLDHFDLDLTAETLTLVFSETMDVTNLFNPFDATKIVLQSGSDKNGAVWHRLAGEVAQTNPARADSTQIVVKLLKDDLEVIKSKRGLATGDVNGDDNTWISIANELVNDQSNIAVTEVAEGSAQRVRTFTSDGTKPVLESFTLDMADGKVVLSFTETMEGGDDVPLDKVDMGLMTIQNTDGVTSAVTESVPLGGGTYLATDGLTVEFVVSTAELNALKKLQNLAVDGTNTFIKLSANAVTDMASNGILEQVVVAANVAPDDIRPKVLSFTTSMVTGSESITITFDETMNVDNLLTEHIYLFGGSDPSTNTPYEFNAADSSSVDGTVIKIDIETTDVDLLKAKDICTAADKCYLGLSSLAITDMAGLSVETVTGKNTGSLADDITKPEISQFVEFDYDANTLTLSFSEPVDPLTINANAIRLDSAQQMDVTDAQNTDFFYNLVGGSTRSGRGATIVIDLERVDMNAIKQRPALCASTFSCYVRATITGGAQNDQPLIKDTFGNSVVEVTNADVTRKAQAVQLDTQGAVLEKFVINLELNKLTLTFNEPVASHEVEASFITIQNADGSASYKLNGGPKDTANLPQYGAVSEVTLLDADVLAIKAITNMATKKDDTYIAMTDSVVKDLRQVKNAALPNVALNLPVLKATDYVDDATDPEIVSFEAYDATLGQLRVSFNEPMDKDQIDGSKITLYANGDEAGLEGVDFFKLTGYDSSAYSDDETKLEVVITLLKDDFEKVLIITGLASQKSNTHVSIGAAMIQDTSGRPNVATIAGSALNVEIFGNVQEASLDNFDLDLDGAGMLTLRFSGVVDVSTFNAKYLTLQNSADGSGGEEHTLTTASSTSSSSGFEIVVDLDKADLDAMKSFRNLCTGKADTFLSMDSKVVRDFSERDALPLAVDKAIQVNDYDGDATPPNLDGFEFSLDNGQGKGVLTLSFSEVVDITQKQLTSIIFQDAATPTIDAVRLTGGTVTETDTDTTMTIELDDADLNAIKHVDGLAVSATTTFISIDSTLIKDMTPNAITANVVLEVAENGFTQDSTSPTVTGFDLDMSTSMLYLTFSETVELASLTATGITFQDHKTSPSVGGSYTLQNAGTKAEVSETQLTLELDDADMNAIKANAFLTPATTIFMIFAEGAVTDPKPNNIEAIPSSNAVTATLYTSDDVDPQLHPTKSFDLNMNDGYILMHFTETIKEGSFVPGSLTLYSAASTTVGVKSHGISSNSLVEIGHADNVDSDYTSIRIALDKSDMDAIKNIPLLANNKAHTHISFSAGAFTDVDDNLLVGIAHTSAKEAGNWVVDSTPPELFSFSLNMNSNTLTLNFNEPVDDSIVDFSAISIQSKESINDAAGATKVTLAGVQSKTRSDDGMVITLVLKDTDINKKTKDAGLAISDGTTFISMTDTFINDMAGVDVKPIADTTAQQTPNGGHTPDSTRPELNSWDLDMDNAKLTLHFLETMEISSLNVDQIKLQASATVDETSVNGDVPTQVQLNGAAVVSNSEDGLDVVIQLTNNEMNELKRKNIGRTSATSWLEILEGGIADMNTKKVVPRVNLGGSAMAVDGAEFRPDVSPPTLDSFEFSMATGIVILSFSETVKASTVKVAQDFVLSSGAANSLNFESYSLGTDVTGHTYTTSSDGPVITLQLATKDLNAIKALSNLATSAGNCHLSVGSGAQIELTDMDLNPLVVVDTLAVDSAATKFQEDNVKPTLVDWKLSMNGAGLLTLTFDETMAPAIDTSMLILQWKADDATHFRRLVGGTASTARSTEITITMDVLDMNAIKKNTNLAVDAGSVFLQVEGGAISDMNAKPVNAVGADAAQVLSANNFEGDTTDPNLVAFTFDMNDFELSLTFDETILASSVTPTALTFVKDAASHLVGSFDTKSLEDGTVIVIKLAVDDMNALKLDQVLAVDHASTALAFGTAFAKDMTGVNTITAFGADAPLGIATVNGYNPDSVGCEITSFRLDLNDGEITIVFDETVDAATLGAGLTLQSAAQLQDGVTQHFTLGASTPVDVDGTSITLNMEQADLNEIARNDNLCTAVGNCYLSVTSAAAFDMTGSNTVVESVTNVGNGNLVNDAKKPTLLTWSMDTELGWIKGTFSETIDASTFQPSFVKIDGPGSSGGVTLDENSEVVDTDGTIITIDIGAASLDLIKQFLAEETVTVHVVMNDGTFFDMAPVGNALVQVQKDIEQLIEDSTDPFLESWELDMETGTITFHISEIVKINSLKTELFTLEGAGSAETFTLTDRDE